MPHGRRSRDTSPRSLYDYLNDPQGRTFQFNSYGRYRELLQSPSDTFYGKDVNGVPLNNNSLLGRFITFKQNKPFTTVNQFVGGTLTRSFSSKRTWDILNPGPPYRSGGPFVSVDVKFPSSFTQGAGSYSDIGKPGVHPDNRTVYQGTFVDNGNWSSDSISSYRIIGPQSLPVLSGYHTIAWDKLKPRIERASIGQFLYELKDLPGQLRTSADLFRDIWSSTYHGVAGTIMTPHRAADNFLNHEFGWAPFIGDIQKMIQAYLTSRDALIALVRDNGQWKKRFGVLEETDTNSKLVRFYGGAALPGSGNFRLDALCEPRIVDGISCTGLTDIWIRDKSRVWAEGSFKFYRPEFDDKLIGFESELMNVQRLLTLYGLRISPSLLWRITPWTWLVDWFTHLGDFIFHWDEFINDGIVARYLYIMKQTERYATKTSTQFFYSGPLTLQWQRSLAIKRRAVSDSPYGFDRPWTSLSPMQYAILGAIGITRSGHGFVASG